MNLPSQQQASDADGGVTSSAAGHTDATRAADDPRAGTSRVFGLRHALLPEGWAEHVLVTVDAEGLIEAVTTADDRAETQNVEWLAGPVVPGTANVHSHAHQRLMAGLAERSSPAGTAARDTFWTWRDVMFSFVERISPEQLQVVAEQAFIEMLEAGFTAVGEFQYLHNPAESLQQRSAAYDNPAEMSLRCLEAARNTGIACTMLPVLYARGGFDGRELVGGQRRFSTSVDTVLEIVDGVSASLAKSGADQHRERVGLAPHSLRAVSISDLEQAAREFCAGHPSGPIHIHVAEQLAEVTDCMEHSGQRPMERLMGALEDSATPVDHRWCLIHSTHIDHRECDALAASGAVVGLCPTTEANLGDGTFPARRLTERAGRLAIGSDSLIRISVAEDLRQLETSQRLRDHERNVLAAGPDRSTGRTLFEHAVINGAQALSQPMGRLATGNRADFVVLNQEHDRLFARTGDGWLDSWIFAGDNTCVNDVYVGGSKLVEQGRHIRRQDVEKRFRNCARDLLQL